MRVKPESPPDWRSDLSEPCPICGVVPTSATRVTPRERNQFGDPGSIVRLEPVRLSCGDTVTPFTYGLSPSYPA